MVLPPTGYPWEGQPDTQRRVSLLSPSLLEYTVNRSDWDNPFVRGTAEFPRWLVGHSGLGTHNRQDVEWGMCTGVCRRTPESEELWGSILKFTHACSGNRTQVVRLGSKNLYLANHLTSPKLLFKIFLLFISIIANWSQPWTYAWGPMNLLRSG